ncbi:hypothetical protein D3C80_1736360 [compost metagenome]
MRGQCFDRAGLGQAGQAFEQDMAVRQQAQQHMPNRLGLPQHLLGDTCLQCRNLLAYAHALAPWPRCDAVNLAALAERASLWRLPVRLDRL